jgi:hypothetical protein
MRHIVWQNVHNTPDIRTGTRPTPSSWRLTHHSSREEVTRLRQTIGSAPSSQSSAYLTVQSIKSSVCSSAAQRFSRGLVGILHRHTSSRPSCAMERVPHCLPWSPPVNGHYALQACGVSESVTGKPLCLRVYSRIQQSGTVRDSPC